MLSPHRIPMNEKEDATVDKIVADTGIAAVSISRNDPGEQGPVRLEQSDGTVWLIDGNGKAKEEPTDG